MDRSEFNFVFIQFQLMFEVCPVESFILPRRPYV